MQEQLDRIENKLDALLSLQQRFSGMTAGAGAGAGVAEATAHRYSEITELRSEVARLSAQYGGRFVVANNGLEMDLHGLSAGYHQVVANGRFKGTFEEFIAKCIATGVQNPSTETADRPRAEGVPTHQEYNHRMRAQFGLTEG